jgi:hypothetical protein
MYNPAEVLTKNGLEEYNAHLFNIQNGLRFITNHADDLHLCATPVGQRVFHLINQMQISINNVLRKGRW